MVDIQRQVWCSQCLTFGIGSSIERVQKYSHPFPKSSLRCNLSLPPSGGIVPLKSWTSQYLRASLAGRYPHRRLDISFSWILVTWAAFSRYHRSRNAMTRLVEWRVRVRIRARWTGIMIRMVGSHVVRGTHNLSSTLVLWIIRSLGRISGQGSLS